jgi:hypothetical protein
VPIVDPIQLVGPDRPGTERLRTEPVPEATQEVDLDRRERVSYLFGDTDPGFGFT